MQSLRHDMQGEFDNLRSALTWALGESGDATRAARLAGELRYMWKALNLLAEAQRWIESALALCPADPVLEAGLWLALAPVSMGKSHVEAAQRCIELLEKSGTTDRLADAYDTLAIGLVEMQRLLEARAAAERAIAIYRERREERTWPYAHSLANYAVVLSDQGNYVGARAAYHDAIVLSESLNEPEHSQVVHRFNLADIEFNAGNPEAAIGLIDEVIHTARTIEYIPLLAHALCNGAAYRLVTGDRNGASKAAWESLTLALESSNSLLAAVAMQHIAAFGALRNRMHEAAKLLGYSDAAYEEHGYARMPTEQRAYDIALAAIRERLGEREWNADRTHGAALTEKEAVEMARTLAFGDDDNAVPLMIVEKL